MVDRRRRSRHKGTGTRKVGSYFVEQSGVEFIHSGCAVLDACLGGGYPLGRITNIVGDRSTGKTLLAMEAFANFHKQFPSGRMFYLEAEAAFDKAFAREMGMPVDRVEFVESAFTVEEFYSALQSAVAEANSEPAIFVVDSLDALSDAAEIGREIDKGSFGAEKAKKLSELFRKLVKHVEQSRLNLMIISQVRDAIGVTFGRKHRRSGGKALDFYASQILWLSETGKLSKTIRGIKRPVGVSVKGYMDKSKVGLPYRTCAFDILFGFGVDSVGSSIKYLEEVGKLNLVEPGLTKTKLVGLRRRIDKMGDVEYRKVDRRLAEAVRRTWSSVEGEFLPTRRKY